MTDATRMRFQELLDSTLDRTCSDAEQQELARLLNQNHELSVELAKQLQLHSLLRWQCGEVKTHLANLPPWYRQQCEHRQASAIGQTIQFVVGHWKWGAAAALLLAAGLVWSQWRSGTGNQTQVAEIVDDQRVVWTSQTTARKEGGQIVPGRIEMKSGTLTLRFCSGATMSATGEVSMRIDSDMLVWLDRGQATAEVSKEARGFTIRTPYVEVVDLGTRFGVLARDKGATDVVVFEGQVDLKAVSPSEKPQKRLSKGEGVRVGNAGTLDRILEVRQDTSGARWTTEQTDWSDTTFKSISDNIPSAECRTYYQITSHGLVDDCPAYPDLPSEWNGLTSDGLPEFLQHADYVMTRNDYRYINKFEMLVELARPANLYVFFDQRVPPPKWLTDQFENTGVDIGLDEGPWNAKDTVHFLAQGGGNSIDNVFSVWRRRCATAETVRLGSMGTVPGARAMYGVAAQPLE